MGEKGGAMVRALASLQCGPGVKSNAICGLNLLLVLFLAEIFFFWVLWFPSRQNRDIAIVSSFQVRDTAIIWRNQLRDIAIVWRYLA